MVPTENNELPQPFEEVVMTAIIMVRRNEERASGAAIQRAIESLGRSTTMGAVHTTLKRLEVKRFVEIQEIEPVIEGSRRRKLYTVSELGRAALRRVRAHRKRMEIAVPQEALV